MILSTIEQMPVAVPIKVLGITAKEAVILMTPLAELFNIYKDIKIVKIKVESVKGVLNPKRTPNNCKTAIET